ncbi:MAG: aldehyde dehydrogenase family protein, partial [Bdellovibrionota bacterium]
IVLKPSSVTPGSAKLLTFTFEEAGLPAGVLNLVFGQGSVVGPALAADLRVKAMSFTGSVEVARDLAVLGAQRGLKLQLLVCAKNTMVVCADADLDRAIEATVQGAFGSTGQRCTATARALVEKPVFESFRRKLIEKVRAIKVGDGLADPTAMGPVVDEKQYRSVLDAIERAKKEGATVLCGGEPVGPGDGSRGYFIAPTAMDNVKPEMAVAREEVFGPVLCLIAVDDFKHAIKVGNAVEFGLSSSIYTSDVQRVFQYAAEIETGILHINSPTVGGEAQAPFGGMKATGVGGREMGSTGPEFFCDIKTVYVDTNAVTRPGNLY